MIVPIRDDRRRLSAAGSAAGADASAPRRSSGGRAAVRLDGERSRARILDAAERLFAERGYAGSGIAAISRESGLPPSSIYWFFESKQDLAIAVIARGADRWLDELSGEHGDSPSFLQFMERALEKSGARLPEFARLQMLLALELGATEPEVLERLQHVRDRALTRMRELLGADLAQVDAERAPALAEDLAFLSMAFVQGALLGQFLEPARIDTKRLGEELRVAIRAIAAHRLARGDAG